MSLSIAHSLAALTLLAMVAGCGSSDPGLVPVRGKITLDGGPWPQEGTINFTPIGTAQGPQASQNRPGSAKFFTDGSFTAGSFKDGDGLFPGAYSIALDCPESPPKMTDTGRMIEGKNAVPKNYRNPTTSGLTLTVKANERADVNLDVKTK